MGMAPFERDPPHSLEGITYPILTGMHEMVCVGDNRFELCRVEIRAGRRRDSEGWITGAEAVIVVGERPGIIEGDGSPWDCPRWCVRGFTMEGNG